MRIVVADLSVKQNIFPAFDRIFSERMRPVFVPGFEPPYPPLDRDDVMVLTGSEHSILDDLPWLPPLMEWVRRHYDAGGPVLGVCYGHQLLARVLSGRVAVRRAARPEMTFIPIEVTKNDRLFQGLPNPFLCLSAHYDEVAMLPDRFEPLARSADCAIQAMREVGGRVIGLQFHPEIDPDFARRCIPPEEKRLLQSGIKVADLLEKIPKGPTGAERILLNALDVLNGAG